MPISYGYLDTTATRACTTKMGSSSSKIDSISMYPLIMNVEARCPNPMGLSHCSLRFASGELKAAGLKRLGSSEQSYYLSSLFEIAGA